jgi:hypothetical protein
MPLRLMPLPPLILRHAAIFCHFDAFDAAIIAFSLSLRRYSMPLPPPPLRHCCHAFIAMPPCRHTPCRVSRFSCHTLSPPFTLIFRCFHYFREMPLHAA